MKTDIAIWRDEDNITHVVKVPVYAHGHDHFVLTCPLYPRTGRDYKVYDDTFEAATTAVTCLWCAVHRA